MAFDRERMFRLRVAVFLSACLFLRASAEAAPSVVIDVASGQILEQEQATASWYPASLTKLMTVFVALQAVRENRLTLETPIMMSPRACGMTPSKMGFRAGSEVTLGNALIMLMVKSANDIAVAIAEGVSGSVEAFADEMNKASGTLGMRESFWVNPNGLPDSRQVTSARDLAILGRALYVQFPEHAGLFNVGAMQLGRQIIPTHNGMLGRYPGADGMKTGFTCSAGFNLVASATRGGRRLIAVVLGAPSASARTAKAASILDRAFTSGSPQGSLEALPSFGIAAAPDMHEGVCRHRAKAAAKFLAEVEDVAIPIGSASTGIPLLDAVGGGGARAHVSAKQVAALPRPQFEPVKVFVGRTPGYQGPVARPRAPGEPVGAGPEIAAYANEKEEAGATPISHAASDAKSLRRHGKHHKHQPAEASGSRRHAHKAKTSGADSKTKKKQAKQSSGKGGNAKQLAVHNGGKPASQKASTKQQGQQ
jgi:D-alanyl-D-alanine carboxypeptidase